MFDVVIQFINFNDEEERLVAKMTIDSKVSSINVIRDIAIKRLYEIAAVKGICLVKISCIRYYGEDDIHSGVYYRGIEFMDNYEFVGDIRICGGDD